MGWLQLIEIVGRKPLTVYNFAICGVSCLLCALVPAGVVRTVLAVIGKFGAAIAFIILFLYTTELFPTVVRNAALGSNSAAARVGGMLAPVVVLLAKEVHMLQLPFLIFGVVSIIAGMLSTLSTALDWLHDSSLVSSNNHGCICKLFWALFRCCPCNHSLLLKSTGLVHIYRPAVSHRVHVQGHLSMLSVRNSNELVGIA